MCYNFSSSFASTCCGKESCQPLDNTSVLCLKGDFDLDDTGCQKDTYCEVGNAECPKPSQELDGTSCNNGSNVCENGTCTGMEWNWEALVKTCLTCFLAGSPCQLFEGKPDPCYCQSEEEVHV